MEPHPDASGDQYAAVVASGDRLLVALDFDGTLSPIVPDPAAAVIHAEAPEVLAALARQVRVVAVVTGRPARQVLALGRLEEVAANLGAGHELVVLGQYGNERWSSATGRVVSPPPPAEVADLLAELPTLLREADAADAWIEEKGLAVAVHTRRTADPAAAFDRLLPVLTKAAQARGLLVEPGRYVVEVRAPGMDKGVALRRLVEEYDARGVVFVGDDLGDVPAFETAADLRSAGLPALLVCSGSAEQTALATLADLVVNGPDGVMACLRQLSTDLGATPDAIRRGRPDDQDV
jgi:trehalose 6-phosphate phosphatase